jgi:hypothetical protein
VIISKSILSLSDGVLQKDPDLSLHVVTEKNGERIVEILARGTNVETVTTFHNIYSKVSFLPHVKELKASVILFYRNNSDHGQKLVEGVVVHGDKIRFLHENEFRILEETLGISEAIRKKVMTP